MDRNLSSKSFGNRLINKALILIICLVPTSEKTKAQVPIPTAPQLAWQQAELGVVFLYDLKPLIDPVTANKIKLVIESSADEPMIKHFAVYE